MTADEALSHIRERILGSCEPLRIILFGSYARGEAGPDSDLDLLVVMDDVPDKRAARVKLGNQLRGIPFPSDVFVIGADELSQSQPHDLYDNAKREGKTIYERHPHG